jgi:hypothetical protein
MVWQDDSRPLPGNVTVQGHPNPAAYRQIAGKVPPLSLKGFKHYAAKNPKWLTYLPDYCALHLYVPVVRELSGYFYGQTRRFCVNGAFSPSYSHLMISDVIGCQD